MIHISYDKLSTTTWACWIHVQTTSTYHNMISLDLWVSLQNFQQGNHRGPLRTHIQDNHIFFLTALFGSCAVLRRIETPDASDECLFYCIIKYSPSPLRSPSITTVIVSPSPSPSSPQPPPFFFPIALLYKWYRIGSDSV